MYTIKQTAEKLLVNPQTIRRRIADGKIECMKHPGMTGKLLFTDEHINNYINKFMKL